MGFFSAKKENTPPAWLADVIETRERFFAFLEKLEEKMKELCEAAIPELTSLHQNDTDVYKREYQRMQSAVLGQLETIRVKARDVHDEKILGLIRSLSDEGIRATHPHFDTVNDFRNACSDRYNIQFEAQIQHWRSKISETGYEDLEIKYQEILKEYDAIKDKFSCSQCGAGITIPQLFLIETYVACPACQTQNSFSPGTRIQMLQNFAQDLASQRTEGLYQAVQNAKAKERELYHKIHNLKLETDFEKDRKLAAQNQQRIAEWENERQQAIADEPVLYEQYIRAKYAEWIKITPDFETHLRTRMENDLKNYYR